MERALIIFVRNPELGQVKTRLAAQIGADKALKVYEKLLAHTRSVLTHIDCDVTVFATGTLQSDYWNNFTIEQQNGRDLGERMFFAFEMLFRKGYRKVVIIGSDCPELSSTHIEKAFRKLDVHEVTIGPAKDGGYYLLGMKHFHKEVFQNKSWSTSIVFKQTVDTLRELNLSFCQLETLADLDEADDVPIEWMSQLNSSI